VQAATVSPGAQVLTPGQEREMHVIFHTQARKPTGFAFELIPHVSPEPMPLLDMRAVARDRSGHKHTFDSRKLRVSQHDAVAESGGPGGEPNTMTS
jgi:hypothetical protein